MAASQLRLIFACAGIFASFSYSAVKQEDLYKLEFGGEGERFSFTFLALAVERGINAAVALLGLLALGGSGLRIAYSDIFNSGISQMFAMAGANEALRYVSYPTQVLGKSCKMVPVMAGGILLSGKKYSAAQYLQVLIITAGVVVFNFGGKKKSGGSDSMYGLSLIGLSLLMDALTGGLQEKVKKRTKELNPGTPNAKPTQYESMFWTNLSGVIVAMVFAALSGHLSAGIDFCVRFPQVLQPMVMFALASAVGQNFIYYTITQFNPLILSTVTTTRKIFSTIYSVLRNPSKPLASVQWLGCGLVFAGLLVELLETVVKRSSSKAKAEALPAVTKDAPAAKPKKSKKAD
jgi:UDP-galactose transporter B1